MNLPTLEGCTELTVSATELKFKYVGDTLFVTPLALILYQSNYCLEWSNSSPKKGKNFGCKYSYLQCKSGISRVLTSDYYCLFLEMNCSTPCNLIVIRSKPEGLQIEFLQHIYISAQLRMK